MEENVKDEKKISAVKKIILWLIFIVGIISAVFYAISNFNLDLSLSNATKALVDESVKQVLNAPQNVINKVKEQIPSMPNNILHF